MNYRDIQPMHELSVLESFKEFHTLKNETLIILNRPDPPDAIIEINSELTWVEISDAFQNKDWARHITSYAADDKVHVPGGFGLCLNPDQETCKIVEKVILNKYGKETMKQTMTQYGAGILLVGMYTPMTSPEEVIELAGKHILAKIKNKIQIFRSIYLYRNSANSHLFYKLL